MSSISVRRPRSSSSSSGGQPTPKQSRMDSSIQELSQAETKDQSMNSGIDVKGEGMACGVTNEQILERLEALQLSSNSVIDSVNDNSKAIVAIQE